MKDVILELLRARGNVSFAELSKDVDGFRLAKGRSICDSNHDNLVMWGNISEEGVAALESLLEDDLIAMVPTTPYVYLADGMMSGLPVAKQYRQYKKPRWMPVVIKLSQRSIDDDESIRMKLQKCTRCGYDWFPSRPRLPKVCPKCKSHKWNTHGGPGD